VQLYLGENHIYLPYFLQLFPFYAGVCTGSREIFAVHSVVLSEYVREKLIAKAARLAIKAAVAREAGIAIPKIQAPVAVIPANNVKTSLAILKAEFQS
jgi:hypothetical protein